MIKEREHELVEKNWGFEEIVENNHLYCLKKITCVDEKWSSKGWYHFHREKDETFFVIEGTLAIDIELLDNAALMSRYLFTGQSYRIRPGQKHRFRNVGPDKCVFVEASTHHSDEDSIRCKYEMTEDKRGRWIDHTGATVT